MYFILEVILLVVVDLAVVLGVNQPVASVVREGLELVVGDDLVEDIEVTFLLVRLLVLFLLDGVHLLVGVDGEEAQGDSLDLLLGVGA